MGRPIHTAGHGPRLGALAKLALGFVALTVFLAGGPASASGPAAAGLAERPATPARLAARSPVRPSVVSPDWPVYHLDAGRTGNDAAFPAFGGSLTAGWSAALDGAVYAEPLVVNGSIIAATEGDSVYAINPSSGAVVWHRSLGTPVPLSTLPCGDIDPLGITGTPAYDPVTGSLFAVAEVTGPQHVLFALNPSTGAILWSRNVDLAGDDPSTHQQRPALAVANGYVYIGFGGLAGDCGQYVGEVVGVPATGSGATISYRVPTSREGAIWATGGPVVDGSGHVYVSVGNGASTTTYDGTDSVLELSPTLLLLSSFAPSTWASDNATDADLGSLSPVLVPSGWVFIAGKSGTGYVLKQGALGGIGGQVSSAPVCTGFGGAAQSGGTIYVPCLGSLREVQVGTNGSLTVGWQSTAAGGPPVIGGGAVWSVNTSTGRLVALDPVSGATLSSISVGAVPHFVSPTLWGNQILVGTDAGIRSIDAGPSPAATFHALTPSRVLDSRISRGASLFHSQVKQTVSIANGTSGVPTDALAVTGTVTVVNQTGAGFVTVAPGLATGVEPGTSTLNFPTGDIRANGVTVALAAGGNLDVMYWASTAGPTADVLFDVTGYFGAGTSGATYHTVPPSRVLDSRSSKGGTTFNSQVKQTVLVANGASGVPATAAAVTGNVTVVGGTAGGYVTVAPSLTSGVQPVTSTVNFPTGDIRAGGVTVALAAGGNLDFMYWAASPGPTVQVVFDVTGYFSNDSSGVAYHTLAPHRVLDSRISEGGATFHSQVEQTVLVANGLSGVPATAAAVTGNVTVVGGTAGGYVTVAPSLTGGVEPGTSTLNFPTGDIRANGVTPALATGGNLDFMYWAASPGPTVQAILDVTGYFGS